jgi:two-component sensor histidine kinase
LTGRGISSRGMPESGFVIEVADDGVGLPEGFDPAMSAGAGLRLMRALAEQIGGRLDLEQHEIGLRVRLEVPATAGLTSGPPGAEGALTSK